MPQTCPTRLHSAGVWYNPRIHGNANGAKGQEKVNEHRKKQRLRGAVAFITLMGVVSPFSDMTHEGARSILGEYLNLAGVSRHHRLCNSKTQSNRRLYGAFLCWLPMAKTEDFCSPLFFLCYRYKTNHCVSRGAFPSAYPDLMSAMAELNLRESWNYIPRK